MWTAVLVGAMALDFVIYVQHVLFHAVPTLWRLHKVHHTDRDQPSQGHTGMTIGLDQHPDPAQQHLAWALLLPFRR